MPLWLLICDLDHFKPYNDHYGLQAGDRCLQAVATALDQCINRTNDLVVPLSGE